MATYDRRITAAEQLRIAVDLMRAANFLTAGAAVPVETVVAVERSGLDLLAQVKQ